MARQQSEFPSNGRQGELQVQRGADMPPRDTELRDMPTRDTDGSRTIARRALPGPHDRNQRVGNKGNRARESRGASNRCDARA